MSRIIRNLALVAITAALALGGATGASADTFARHGAGSVVIDYPIYDPPPPGPHYVPPPCQPTRSHKCPVGVSE